MSLRLAWFDRGRPIYHVVCGDETLFTGDQGECKRYAEVRADKDYRVAMGLTPWSPPDGIPRKRKHR